MEDDPLSALINREKDLLINNIRAYLMIYRETKCFESCILCMKPIHYNKGRNKERKKECGTNGCSQLKETLKTNFPQVYELIKHYNGRKLAIERRIVLKDIETQIEIFRIVPLNILKVLEELEKKVHSESYKESKRRQYNLKTEEELVKRARITGKNTSSSKSEENLHFQILRGAKKENKEISLLRMEEGNTKSIENEEMLILRMTKNGIPSKKDIDIIISKLEYPEMETEIMEDLPLFCTDFIKDLPTNIKTEEKIWNHEGTLSLRPHINKMIRMRVVDIPNLL